jgi:hypothetical protein
MSLTRTLLCTCLICVSFSTSALSIKTDRLLRRVALWTNGGTFYPGDMMTFTYEAKLLTDSSGRVTPDLQEVFYLVEKRYAAIMTPESLLRFQSLAAETGAHLKMEDSASEAERPLNNDCTQALRPDH